MKPSFVLFFLLLLFFSGKPQSYAQGKRYLVLDRYTPKRIYIAEGSKLVFKLKKSIDPSGRRITDYITFVNDSTLALSSAQMQISPDDLAVVYIPREAIPFLRGGLSFIAGGFIFAAIVHPIIEDARYDAAESAVIGGTALALSQIIRVFKWKKYRVRKKNTRARILDLGFKRGTTEPREF